MKNVGLLLIYIKIGGDCSRSLCEGAEKNGTPSRRPLQKFRSYKGKAVENGTPGIVPQQKISYIKKREGMETLPYRMNK